MKKIAIINFKGGVGKTVVALNLGAALQQKGKRILLIDLDPAAGLTFALIGTDEIGSSSLDFLIGSGIQPLILRQDLELIPSSLSLESLDKRGIEEKDLLLKKSLRRLQGFDYVLIDTPPAINIFSLMAAVASDSVYSVIGADFLSLNSLLAVEEMIRALKEKVNHRIILNLFDRRRRLEKDLFATFLKNYQGRIFKIPVRRSVLVPESIVLGRPVVSYRSTSPVAQDFKDLADEVIRKEGR